MSALPPISDVNLLWYCYSIIHFNAEMTNSVVGMAIMLLWVRSRWTRRLKQLMALAGRVIE